MVVVTESIVTYGRVVRCLPGSNVCTQSCKMAKQQYADSRYFRSIRHTVSVDLNAKDLNASVIVACAFQILRLGLQ